MQAPQDVKKNFIDLVSEAAEEQGLRPSRQSPGKPERKGILALISAAWPRSHRPGKA